MTSKGSYPEEYRRSRSLLAKVGWVAVASLLERSEAGQGGPRYQTSRRVEGRTVTVQIEMGSR